MAWYEKLKLFSRKEVAGVSESMATTEQRNAIVAKELHLDARAISEAVKRGGDIYDPKDYRVASALAATYMKVSDSRKKLIRDVDRMRSFYLVDVIITQITEDALAPEIGTGYVLEASSNNPEIQKEIDLLEEKFDFDQLAMSITPDLLAYGEYTLEAKIKANPRSNNVPHDPQSATQAKMTKGDENKLNEEIEMEDDYGLDEIKDTVDQGSVVAISKWNHIEGYVVSDGKGQIVWKEPADFIKFSLSSTRVRIDLFKEFGLKNIPEKWAEKLPRFVRVGKSVIYPIIAKLKELELLEALVPATKLSKLSQGSLIGVSVPAGMDIERAMDVAKQMEQLINKKVGVDPVLGELTIENIMSVAGRIKTIPQFGDKGQLSKMDYKPDEPDELLSSLTDIRKAILTSVGIPYELVFGGEDSKKGEILKKYARYLRKLKNIQKSIEEGIRQIIYIHLANKGIDFKTDDIKVEFMNKLIEVDNLDKLEFMDTTVGLLDNVKKFVLEINDTPATAGRVNVEALLQFLNDQLNVIGFTNIIKVDPKDTKPQPDATQDYVDTNPEQDELTAEPNNVKPVYKAFSKSDITKNNNGSSQAPLNSLGVQQ